MGDEPKNKFHWYSVFVCREQDHWSRMARKCNTIHIKRTFLKQDRLTYPLLFEVSDCFQGHGDLPSQHPDFVTLLDQQCCDSEFEEKTESWSTFLPIIGSWRMLTIVGWNELKWTMTKNGCNDNREKETLLVAFGLAIVERSAIAKHVHVCWTFLWNVKEKKQGLQKRNLQGKAFTNMYKT